MQTARYPEGINPEFKVELEAKQEDLRKFKLLSEKVYSVLCCLMVISLFFFIANVIRPDSPDSTLMEEYWTVVPLIVSCVLVLLCELLENISCREKELALHKFIAREAVMNLERARKHDHDHPLPEPTHERVLRRLIQNPLPA